MSQDKGRHSVFTAPRLILLGVMFILIGLIVVFVSGPGGATGDGSFATTYEVRRGIGANTVAGELGSMGLVQNPTYFKWWLRLTGRGDDIKAGVYSLNDSMSAAEIADVLTEGRVQLSAITIPEGWNNRQIGDYLAEEGLVEDREAFLEIASDPEVLRRYDIEDPTTEGYLFPDTYMIPDGYTAEQLQELMLQHHFEVVSELTAGKDFSNEEIRDRIVLASIVEREAVNPEERPMMAQVFLNRIDKGMRLESCATIQYLFDEPRPRIYFRDLEIQSPYNTYKNTGLPPGPISNPGRAAIEAAFKPEPSEFLYFVLKPDGSHHFSLTYDEHLRAKERYIDSQRVVAGG